MYILTIALFYYPTSERILTMYKHTMISYKINGSLKDLIVHYKYSCPKDLEITRVHELGHPEDLPLTEKQREDLLFICQEALPFTLASESEYLHDILIPR
jgi:hypothetical protein